MKLELGGELVAGDRSGRLRYDADLHEHDFHPASPAGLTAFLMERYTAFTERRGQKGFFRIWHPPWPQAPVNVRLRDRSLLRRTGLWFHGARHVGANYSPGVEHVWIGRPQRCRAA